MKFVFASDSFKGSLTSKKIAELLADCAKKHFSDAVCQSLEIADGGEGTLESIAAIKKGEYKTVKVKNPINKKIFSKYYTFDDTAVIAIAEASGITLIKDKDKNPLLTTTYGTGQLIKDAILSGYKNIIIGIGGSATNDGGMGAMSALGFKFLDYHGAQLDGKGESLINVAAIDKSSAMQGLAQVNFTVLCDVDNPLTGENGATYTFSKQKGATALMEKQLEQGMINYKAILEETFNVDIDNVKSGGAAGGLGVALKVFLNAKMSSGIDTVLSLHNFDEVIKDADYVITGEGRIDGQSLDGKVISGLATHCKLQKKPLIVICGSVGNNIDKLYEQGVTAIFSIINAPMALEKAITDAEILYHSAADNVFRLLKKLSI